MFNCLVYFAPLPLLSKLYRLEQQNNVSGVRDSSNANLNIDEKNRLGEI